MAAKKARERRAREMSLFWRKDRRRYIGIERKRRPQETMPMMLKTRKAVRMPFRAPLEEESLLTMLRGATSTIVLPSLKVEFTTLSGVLMIEESTAES